MVIKEDSCDSKKLNARNILQKSECMKCGTRFYQRNERMLRRMFLAADSIRSDVPQ